MLRRWRGRTEIVAIEALEPEQPIFGAFRVRSGSGGSYDVEIRSLDGLTNSCGCIDHRANGLGTCKHIEGVTFALQRRNAKAVRAAAAAGSPRVELFLDRRDAPRPTSPGPQPPAHACKRRANGSRRSSHPMERSTPIRIGSLRFSQLGTAPRRSCVD